MSGEHPHRRDDDPSPLGPSGPAWLPSARAVLWAAMVMLAVILALAVFSSDG